MCRGEGSLTTRADLQCGLHGVASLLTPRSLSPDQLTRLVPVWDVGSGSRGRLQAGDQAFCVDDPDEARAIWYGRRGLVRSCVRPTLRGLRTAGPDAIRSLAPKQIYALEGA